MSKYQLSIDAYRKAIALDPNRVLSFRQIAMAFRRLRQFTDAIDAYKSAVAIDPNDSDSYEGLGIMYKALKQYPLAAAAYRSFIQINPAYPWARIRLGEIYLIMSNRTQAFNEFDMAIYVASGSEVSLVCYNQGNVFRKHGYFEEAIQVWQKGIAELHRYSSQATGIEITDDNFQASIRQARQMMKGR